MYTFPVTFAIAAIGLIALAAPAGAASYFVQDKITSNNPLALLGGLDANGQTSRNTAYDQGTTSIGTSANLADGMLRGRLHSVGKDAIRGMSSAFGDQVTVVGGAGTNVDFNLQFDAMITAAADALGKIPMLLVGSTRFAVFDPAVGATAGNWTSLAFPLLGGPGQSLGKDLASFGYHGVDKLPISDILGEMLSVTLPVVSDNQSFDFFANMTATILGGDTPINLDIEFSSLASLGLSSGVTIHSASGAFLTAGPNATPQTPSQVPLPASALLLLGALASLGWGWRRKAAIAG